MLRWHERSSYAGKKYILSQTHTHSHNKGSIKKKTRESYVFLVAFGPPFTQTHTQWYRQWCEWVNIHINVIHFPTSSCVCYYRVLRLILFKKKDGKNRRQGYNIQHSTCGFPFPCLPFSSEILFFPERSTMLERNTAFAFVSCLMCRAQEEIRVQGSTCCSQLLLWEACIYKKASYIQPEWTWASFFSFPSG